MLMPTLKIPTIRQALQFTQQADCVFSNFLKNAYLHTPIVKYHHSYICLGNEPDQGKVLLF